LEITEVSHKNNEILMIILMIVKEFHAILYRPCEKMLKDLIAYSEPAVLTGFEVDI